MKTYFLNFLGWSNIVITQKWEDDSTRIRFYSFSKRLEIGKKKKKQLQCKNNSFALQPAEPLEPVWLQVYLVAAANGAGRRERPIGRSSETVYSAKTRQQRWAATSVTRFGEISTIWQNFNSLWDILVIVLYLLWQILCYFGKFSMM